MLKRILFAVLFAPLLALAQSYPSPTVQNLTVLGTYTGPAPTFTTPLPVASGGTNSASASGSALDNITGFAGTGFIRRTGAGAYSFVASPLPVANGGTNAASASGTALDNISGFASTGFMSRTGAGAYSFTGSTGSGNVVLATSPALTTPNLGTPSAVTLTNGTGLPISSGVSGLGTGVGTALGVATNASGGVSLTNGTPTAGNCLKWSATGVQDSGSVCYDTVVYNVRSYGALGNSNGTHGNGNDDTTAFQNALNAASSSSLFIPCGTYRITAPLTITDANPRWIFGNGQCTKIYSDQSVANITFNFNPAGTCGAGSSAACAIFANMVFLTPNTVGGGQAAISFSKTNSPYIDNVTFIGQQVGAQYTNSFAPRIHNSRFYSGVAGLYSTDISFNSGEIWSNSFFNTTGKAIQIEPASGCAVATSIKNNDMENNAIAISIGGICGGEISNNYIEATHTLSIFNFLGTNSSILFEANSINAATDTSTGSTTISNLTNAQFVNNSLYNWVITYGGSVSQVRFRKNENTLSTVTLPATTVSCASIGTGGTCSIFAGDDYSGLVSINTGTTPPSGGSITLTFTNAIGPNKAHCNFTPINNTGSWTAPLSLIGNSAAATGTLINWVNGASLTASVNYLMGYTCSGY